MDDLEVGFVLSDSVSLGDLVAVDLFLLDLEKFFSLYCSSLFGTVRGVFFEPDDLALDDVFNDVVTVLDRSAAVV